MDEVGENEGVLHVSADDSNCSVTAVPEIEVMTPDLPGLGCLEEVVVALRQVSCVSSPVSCVGSCVHGVHLFICLQARCVMAHKTP